MTAAVYMDVMGKKGIAQAAESSMSKAHYLANRLCEIDGFELVYQGEFFNEFVTTCKGNVDNYLSALEQRGILGGLALTGKDKGRILWCATEMNSKEDIDTLIAILKDLV